MDKLRFRGATYHKVSAEQVRTIKFALNKRLGSNPDLKAQILADEGVLDFLFKIMTELTGHLTEFGERLAKGDPTFNEVVVANKLPVLARVVVRAVDKLAELSRLAAKEFPAQQQANVAHAQSSPTIPTAWRRAAQRCAQQLKPR